MFRKTGWRKTAREPVRRYQDEALSITIFILREIGPIAFLLKEEGETKDYKVCLGDPHTCTCPAFQREKDLCIHICWILMRKFRLPKDHEYCFQHGLVERQILELLKGLHVPKTTSCNDGAIPCPPGPDPGETDGGVRQKNIETDDVCPICQEELLLKKLPVTYCKFSCGNNVHISCMKVWADHQTRANSQAMLKCPLCRENFGTSKHLIEQVKNAGELSTCYEKEHLDKHLGVVCSNCRVSPIVGKCFKCTECRYFYLCENCYRKTSHLQHCFMVRMRRGQQWQTVEPHAPQEGQGVENHSIPDSISGMKCDTVPAHVIKSLPMVRVRKESRLLRPGAQCRICLSDFKLAQHVRILPCKHKFHTDCIDPLLCKSNSCPLDWHVIYNPLTWNAIDGRTESTLAPSSVAQSKHTDQQLSHFFLPGVALQVQNRTAPSILSPERSEPSVLGSVESYAAEALTQRIQDLCIKSSPIETHSRVTKPNQIKEGRSIHKGLSLGHPVATQVKRKASFPCVPSTFNLTCLTVQSLSGTSETEAVQQRLVAGGNEPASGSTACVRVKLQRKGQSEQRDRPGLLSAQDLCIHNIPVKATPTRKHE